MSFIMTPMKKLWAVLTIFLYACAPNPSNEPGYPYQPTPTPPLIHIVQEGDTCESIATKFDVSEVSFIVDNDLTTDCLLEVGMILKIPPSEPDYHFQPTSTPLIHIVQEGDTCESIATKFDIPEYSLIVVNDLKIDCFLEVGMILKIPHYQIQIIPEGTIFDCFSRVDHAVREGETLEAISSFYGIPVELIMNWNGKTKRDIQPGNILRIPLCPELENRITPTPN